MRRGQVLAFILGEDEQHEDRLGGSMPEVDHPSTPSLAATKGSPAQLPNPPCTRDDLTGSRLLDELQLKPSILICGKEVVDSGSKGLCLNDDHLPENTPLAHACQRAPALISNETPVDPQSRLPASARPHEPRNVRLGAGDLPERIAVGQADGARAIPRRNGRRLVGKEDPMPHVAAFCDRPERSPAIHRSIAPPAAMPAEQTPLIAQRERAVGSEELVEFLVRHGSQVCGRCSGAQGSPRRSVAARGGFRSTSAFRKILRQGRP